MTKSARKHLWQTWWAVVGPKLLRTEAWVRENIVLAPLSEASFREMKGHRAPAPKIAFSSDSFVVRYPPRDEVQSRHKMQINVDAKDADEAVFLAQQQADRFLTSLSLAVSGVRYHAELRKLRRADEDREITGWSQSVNGFSLQEPGTLEPGDLKIAVRLFNEIEKDKTAENAYIHLLTAWELQSTAGAKPLERSTLQHYVLCMEAIVNGVMERVRREQAGKIKEAERAYTNEFAEIFPILVDKPKAIREASTKLRDISYSNTLPSIEEVATRLSISPDIMEHAKNLYRFRSRSLSHPGRPQADAYKKWLSSGPSVSNHCLADVVARAFLVGYCEHGLESTKL
ncbi:hypothetical protein [Mesorhizobium sp. M0130]|uniref:hypothetical protein n=1 Tax=Mesorhizobium sp. M0130 TaxID=2956887 RepID=UPI003339A49E